MSPYLRQADKINTCELWVQGQVAEQAQSLLFCCQTCVLLGFFVKHLNLVQQAHKLFANFYLVLKTRQKHHKPRFFWGGIARTIRATEPNLKLDAKIPKFVDQDES
jgi:hypothetical protein